MAFPKLLVLVFLKLFANITSGEDELDPIILNSNTIEISQDVVPEIKPAVKIPVEHSAGVKLNVKQNLILNQVLGIYVLQSGISDPLCKNHSSQYKQDLRGFEPWALKMFDSSSKIQSSILAGNLIDFGGFDQCLEISEHTDAGLITGQHCVVEIKPSAGFMEVILSFRNITIDRLDDLTGGAGVPVRWSICVPASCPAADVEEHFRRTFESIAEGADVNVTVRNTSCVSHLTRRKLGRGDWAAIILFGTSAVLAIFSTFYDLHCRSNGQVVDDVLIAFSIWTNTINILKPPRTGQMGAVHGLRFITMCWIICGHRFFMTMFFPVDNTLDILDWMTQMSSMVVVGGTFSVDTFFLISGLLVAYVFLTHMDSGASFNIPLYWLHRYLRLTPSYGVTALVYATVLYYMGSGPLWNDLLSLIQAPCADHWWSTLLYIQNFVNPGELCIVQTWYLTCDTQLFMLSPIVLYPLWKWTAFGVMQVAVIILLSMVTAFELAWSHQYRGGMPVTNALLHTDYFRYYYITTHTRASPWLLGVVIGYILHSTKNKKIFISKGTAILLWTSSVTVMLAVVFGAHPFQQPYRQYNRLEAAIYLSTSRFVWGLAISWVIFACVKGYGGLINTFLSLPLFQIWGRLSYNMFLLHMMVQYVIGGNERIQTHFANELSIHLFFGDLAYTSILAFIFTLLFESPIMILESYLLGTGKHKKITPEVSEKGKLPK